MAADCGSDADIRLMEASMVGDIAAAVEAINSGADVCYQDHEGVNAMMRAAEGGHLELVKLLLESGTPWNALDKTGYCAGEYATGGNHREVIEYLLQAGVEAEMVLGAIERERKRETGELTKDSKVYLDEKIRYTADGTALIDEGNEAVMMEWERPLMEQHAALICATHGDVLNIGFGMGIIDSLIEEHGVTSHTISEAHPDVHKKMLADGWADKKGVRIVTGRWQEAMSTLLERQYDGIFFDTYGESDLDLQEFHEYLPRLLKPGGVYSYFNGLCPNQYFFHAVTNEVMRAQMNSMGMSMELQPIPVTAVPGEWDAMWEGIKRPYWEWNTYFMPIVRKPNEAN